MKQKIKPIYLLLVLSSLSFLSLILILSFYNRFAVDDYYLISDVKNYGIYGGMSNLYYSWGGRWTSYLLYNNIYFFYESKLVLFLYSFSVFILFIIAVYILMASFKELLQINFNKAYILFYSILFVSFSFYISKNKGEIWFWVNSTGEYLISLAAFLLGFSLVFFKNKNVFIYIIIALTFTYCGGGCEAFALFFIILLVSSLLIFYNYFKKQSVLKNVLIKFIIALLFIILSFAVSVSAPGNKVRQTFLPEPSVIFAIKYSMISCYKLFLQFISNKLPYIILFILPWIYLGNISNSILKNEKKFRQLIKPFFISFFLLIILLIIVLFPASYILSDVVPDRYLSILNVMTTIFCCCWAFIFGNIFINKKIFFALIYISVSAIIVLNIYTMTDQYKTVSKYSKALNERVGFLKNMKNKGSKNTVTVEPLPSSGFLYSAEISEDTNYFVNEHFRKGLFLDFKVKVKHRIFK